MTPTATARARSRVLTAAVSILLTGLASAVPGCSSGDGPGAIVGEQAGGAVGRKVTDDNPVGEAVGAAAGNAAGGQADKSGGKADDSSGDKGRKDKK